MFNPHLMSSRRPSLGGLTTSMAFASLIAVLVITGCGTPKRTVLSEAQLNERAAADAADMAKTFHNSVSKLISRVESRVDSGDGEPPTIHFLALSGGGDYGAFGAGFLVGWGMASDPQWRRPDFDAVTGVSTGALIAPYAYLGTDEACLAIESFYRNPKKDWIDSRGWLFFLPHNPSFMTIPGLERDIRDAIDESFVAQIAEESRSGKVLAISATDLDLGRQRFWDLGVEAESATAEGDPDRVQRILLASAAIPAIFPAVRIGDSLYADGGVTANVFLRLDTRNPNAFIPRWRAAHPDTPIPRVRYWIIFNNQLHQPPATVQDRWPALIGPSLATAIRSATLAEIRWLAAEADYVNAAYGTDIEVRVVAIPDEWRPPVKGDFKKETMLSLIELGRKMGADPASWVVWAAPEDGSR